MTRWTFLLMGTLFLATGVQAAVIDSPAPVFPYINAKGENRTSDDFKGKVVFINFWASWCAPCQSELPRLNQLADDYQGKNVFFLSINLDKDSAQASRILDKIGLNRLKLYVLWDPESKIVSTFNPEAIPTSYVLDVKGTIRYIHVGYHKKDPDKWRKELDALLNEHP